MYINIYGNLYICISVFQKVGKKFTTTLTGVILGSWQMIFLFCVCFSVFSNFSHNEVLL